MSNFQQTRSDADSVPAPLSKTLLNPINRGARPTCVITCVYILRVRSTIAELRVHFEPSLWKEYEDTAKEHPAARVIGSVVRLYKEIGASTLVMPAR